MREKVKFRWPNRYKLLYAHASIIHRLYYRHITIIGLKNIPPETPLILAPNHQNALMDALAVLFAECRPVVFMARADIFKKPFIAKLLNFMKILPIYRIRDGYGELSKNQEVFQDTVDVLKSNMPVCILPEGNHEGQKRLRPLKKGIFRIAFQAEESMNYGLNLHIVPIGIDYSDYFNPGADLTVVFGTPIKIADYAADYNENEQKTINTLTHKLSRSIREVMIHIPEEHYSLLYQVCEMYEPQLNGNSKRNPHFKITTWQNIVQQMTISFEQFPEKASELILAIDKYNQGLHKNGLDDKLFAQKKPGVLTFFVESLVGVLLLPFYMYGLVTNYIPYKIPVLQAATIKDLHFKSSIQFGIGLVIFPLYYILAITTFCLIADGLLLKLIFAFSLPLTGYFAFYYYKWMKKLYDKFRLLGSDFSKSGKYYALHEERNKIIDLIKTIIKN
jgi:1-acyl-sn-glycerol-3-phosphate acyltransferase